MNWLHRVGSDFVPFDEPYEYNPDTDTLTVTASWNEYFIWNFFADRFSERVEHATDSGSMSSTCDSYEDCGDEPNMACVNAQCVKHETYFHDAVSTAVSALDYRVYDVSIKGGCCCLFNIKLVQLTGPNFILSALFRS